MYTVVVKYRIPFSRPQVFIFSVLIAAALGTFALYSMSPLPDVVVSRTATGFVPSKVTIHKGQAIVFVSGWGKEFWPASDFHPTHGMYPAFDPKRPLQPEEKWRFVFDTAGVWNFHDHLAESVTGTVTVLGKPGETSRECLTHAATSSAGALAECWAVDIKETLERSGLEAAFDVYSSLYEKNPGFRGLACHDAGHILGDAAYAQYEDDHKAIDRPETAFCGYGFYHGFMEAMLRDQGPAQYEKVREYCDALKSDGVMNNPSGACFHGIGHAAFDSIPGDLWGKEGPMVSYSLAICERAMTDPAEREQCGTGVFNALAIAESTHAYKLAFAESDWMKICRAQKAEYHPGCFKEFGIGVIRERNFNRTEAMRFIHSFGNEDAEAAALMGYMGDEMARAIAGADLRQFSTFCRDLSTSTQRDACQRGVLAGLRQAGKPGEEYKLMMDFCSLYPPGTARTSCYSFAIGQSRFIASDKEAFKAACLLGGPETASLCN